MTTHFIPGFQISKAKTSLQVKEQYQSLHVIFTKAQGKPCGLQLTNNVTKCTLTHKRHLQVLRPKDCTLRYMYNTLTVYPKKYSTDQTTKYNSQAYTGMVSMPIMRNASTQFLYNSTQHNRSASLVDYSGKCCISTGPWDLVHPWQESQFAGHTTAGYHHLQQAYACFLSNTLQNCDNNTTVHPFFFLFFLLPHLVEYKVCSAKQTKKRYL